MRRPVRIHHGVADETLAVKAAIDLTLRTIGQRARLYGNLVAAVSVLLVGSVTASVVLRAWWALLGLLLIAPATGAYLAMDARLVRHWVFQMRGLGNESRMSQLLSNAILAHPVIPKETVKSMLTQLHEMN